MISPTKKAATVMADGLAGERRAFTIKATGKAFRTLIDGLYENKIGAVVREIISNGYDAHAAAGHPSLPLNITAPTYMDPTFRVRDFGVSMDHSTIMDLYSTIFESTKESTNDQVGMFGLGSKSPFAYTDSFSVTAFLNGEKRVYVAHISDDDIPQITHVVTEPQGDEPQGVEIAVPVNTGDISSFSKEIGRMAMAADVAPVVEGMPHGNIPAPSISGPGWRVVVDDYGMGQFAIRQGCVIYPVQTNKSQVRWGYTLVMDVPIGSVEVTASRESLSMTPETQEVVRDAVDRGEQVITDFMASIEYRNRLEEFEKANEYEFLLRYKGRNTIGLNPDIKNPTLVGQYVEVYKSARKTRTQSVFSSTNDIVLLVERPDEKVLRKNLRISSFYQSHHWGKVIAKTTPEALPRLVRVLGLKPHQVISVSSLPDVQISRVSGGSGSSPGKFSAPKKAKNSQWWISKRGVKTLNHTIGAIRLDDIESYEGSYAQLVEVLTGVKFENTIFVTERQQETLKVSAKRDLLAKIHSEAVKYAQKMGLQDRLTASAIHVAVNGIDVASRVRKLTSFYPNYAVVDFMTEALSDDIKDLVARIQLSTLSDFERFVIKVLDMTPDQSKIDLTLSDLDDKIKSLVEDNPVLFGEPNRSDYETNLVERLLKFYKETITQEGTT